MVRSLADRTFQLRSKFSPFGPVETKEGPVGVVPKDGSGSFSPFGKRPPEGPVGVRPKDGSTFSPFGPATVKEGPVGVVPKDGSGSFSPFGRRLCFFYLLFKQFLIFF